MDRTTFVLTALLTGLLAGGCLSPHSDLTRPKSWTDLGGDDIVVSRGETLLPIVSDNSPENRWAALFLAQTIGETCGRRPGVLFTKPGRPCAVTNALFIGGTDASLTGEAFRVIARDGSVRFLGRADYAVFDWCERMLGLRYYCKGGKCVEPRTEIVVPAIDYTDAPVFDRRLLEGNSAWARLAKTGNTHRGGVNVHAPHGWFRDPSVRADHPAIFETGRTPMLCYGNPETLDYYKSRIDRHIAGLEDSGGIVDSDRKVVTVCPWDNPIRCTCRWCRPLYADDCAGAASPIVWEHFTTQLAAWLKDTHPDYMISFLPYLNFCGVPKGLLGRPDLLPNAEAEVCTMPGLALLKNESCRDREERLLRDWQAATGRKIINWHYGCWPRDRTSAPYVFGRTIQRHYDAMRDVTAGSFVCGGENDPRLALSMYIWAKCLWNPDLDVEAVYDGFAKRMFGVAAEPMRELIALQERCWERPWTDNDCSYRNIYEISFPPDDVARMKTLLQDAYRRTLLTGDQESAKRVRTYAQAMTRFFDEEPKARTGVGADHLAGEMVSARNANNPLPWARTTVTTSIASNTLAIVVRCDEPAAAQMDFTNHVDDIVWDDDCVTFVLETDGQVRVTKVYKDGTRDGDLPLVAKIAHETTNWTVTAHVTLPSPAKTEDVRGNVCRWRVGDMRLPKERRVPGSRYEHSRLRTRYTHPDADPDALVPLMRATYAE